MNTIEELEQVVQRARERIYASNDAIGKYRQEQREQRVTPLEHAVAREQRAIEVEIIDQYYPALQEAETYTREAQAALDAARVAATQADTGWHPVGTKLRLWEMARFGDKRRYKTDTYALVEVWTDESKYRHTRYGHAPSPGTLVLRLLLKNGQPSAKYLGAYNEWERSRWFPLNETPKEEVAA